MNILKISLKNLKSKPLYTFLSVLVLALSIALLLGVQQLKTSFKHQMENNLGGIDLVVGAKGSPLQLVLASVLHLDNPTGNIPYKDADKIANNRMVKSAVPISYGDNYKGYKIVGTTSQFLPIYEAELQEGRLVKKALEVVLGNSVAKKTNLKIGDTFLSSHGLIDSDVDVHEEKLTVVGILQPTQKVIDRLIVTNLESIWDVHDHEEHHHEEEDAKHHEDKDHDEHDEHHHKKSTSTHFHDGIEHSHSEGEHHDEHDKEENHHHKEEVHSEKHHEESEKHTEHNHAEDYEDKEITSLLLTFKNPTAVLTFPRKINEKTNMQAALPKFELDRLYEFTGVGFKTISWIAYLILVISGLTIFISLYKMIKERAFDLALLRTYGASNFQLIRMISYEALTVMILALVFGFLLAKVTLYAMFSVSKIGGYQQELLQNLSFQDTLQIGGLVFVMVILAILVAVYPITKMNISTILSNEK